MAPETILAAFLAPAVMVAALNPLTGLDRPIRVIGGEDAKHGDFPYAVSLQNRGNHFCTGSLIDAKTILTAGHCIEGVGPFTTIRAGSLYKSKGGRLVNISSAIAHPNFDDAELNSDIGLVKISTPLSANNGVEFATLAREDSDPKHKSMATVAGWGHDSDDSDDELPDKLQKVDLPIVPRSKCRAAWNHLPTSLHPDITEDMICAGYLSDDEYENEESPCAGDSGGPLVDKSTGVVVGITSWGMIGCGTDGAPNVFARVGSLRSFIDKHMEASKHL